MKTSEEFDSSAISNNLIPPQIVVDGMTDSKFDQDQKDDTNFDDPRYSQGRKPTSKQKSRSGSRSRSRSKKPKKLSTMPSKEIRIISRQNSSISQKPKFLKKAEISTEERKPSMGLTGQISPSQTLLAPKLNEDPSLGVDLNISELESVALSRQQVAKKRTRIVILPAGMIENPSSSSEQESSEAEELAVTAND